MQHRESSLRDVQLQSDARYFLYDSNRAGSLPGVCKSVLRLYIPRVWLEAGVELSLHMKESPSTATETATRDRGAEWIGYATIADDLRGCGYNS